MAPELGQQVWPSLAGAGIAAASAPHASPAQTAADLVSAGTLLCDMKSTLGDNGAAVLAASASAVLSMPAALSPSCAEAKKSEQAQSAPAWDETVTRERTQATLANLERCSGSACSRAIEHLRAADEEYGFLRDALADDAKAANEVVVPLADDLTLAAGPSGVRAAVSCLMACRLCAAALGGGT